MKKYISRLLIFLSPLIPILLIVIIYFLNEKKQVNSKLKEISNYKCLIMGDSQMQRINPSFFKTTTYNFASSGEHYYFTYQKIKDIIQIKNYKINKIVLGVSWHSFGPAYNRLFDLNFSQGKDSFKRYFYFIDILESYNDSFITLSDIMSKTTINAIYNTPDWGGLFESDFKNPDSLTINKIFKTHYGILRNENKISSDQIKYLSKINEICNNNDIELYLISLPYHSLYRKKVDSMYIKKFGNTLKSIKHLNYLNLINKNVDLDLMSDAVHLNLKGAAIYSKLINDSINK